MASPSPAISLKNRETGSRGSASKHALLESRRLSELLGLLTGVAGLLILLSLASYLPQDPSLNTSVDAGAIPHNWIGPVGAYAADALFQAFGWVAFLIPLALLVLGVRWLLVRPFEAPRTKAVGAGILVISLAALLELFPYTPAVRGAVPGSGLLGYFAAAGLIHILSRVGAAIVTVTVFLASLFLVTRFSFASSARVFGGCFAVLKRPFAGRWEAWKEARAEKAAERLRKKVERSHVIGKDPVVIQRVATAPGPAQAPVIGARTEPVIVPATGLTPGEKIAPTPSVRLPRFGGERGPNAPRIVGRGAHGYKLPSATLLRPPEGSEGIDENELKDRALRLTRKFAEFGVTGSVTQIHPGPVVTTYEFKPEAGIKYSRITNLADDLCLALKAESILIDRIPGKSTVGIEVPNLHREIIHLREMVESSEFAAFPSKLSLCMGKDITGKLKISDLTQMPHLLIAGSTGAGKSVAINSMVISVLYKSTPDEVKLILIDPKRLELSLYRGIPHLLTPIVTEPKQAANALRRAVIEMEDRLKKLA